MIFLEILFLRKRTFNKYVFYLCLQRTDRRFHRLHHRMDLQIEGKVKIRFQKPMPLKMHLRLAHMNTLMLMMNTYFDFKLQYIDYKDFLVVKYNPF